MADLTGDEIRIEEMPQGCIITQIGGDYIVVSSPKDALMLISSLSKMVAVDIKKMEKKLEKWNNYMQKQLEMWDDYK